MKESHQECIIVRHKETKTSIHVLFYLVQTS